MTRLDMLAERCDDILIASLTPGLRATLDRALAAGTPPRNLLQLVDRKTGGPRGRGTDRVGATLFLAVEAYLARRASTAIAAQIRLAVLDDGFVEPDMCDPNPDEAALVADPSYTPTLDQAMRHPAEFVSAMTETVVIHHGLPPGLGLWRKPSVGDEPADLDEPNDLLRNSAERG